MLEQQQQIARDEARNFYSSLNGGKWLEFLTTCSSTHAVHQLLSSAAHRRYTSGARCQATGRSAAVCGGRVIRPLQPQMHSADNDTKNGFLATTTAVV